MLSELAQTQHSLEESGPAPVSGRAHSAIQTDEKDALLEEITDQMIEADVSTQTGASRCVGFGLALRCVEPWR